jgi:hypothetical protein
VSGQLHALAALLPEEIAPGTLWIGGLVNPRAGLDDVEKILDPIGTRNSGPSVVEPVAGRYTDWAPPAPEFEVVRYKNINKTSGHEQSSK